MSLSHENDTAPVFIVDDPSPSILWAVGSNPQRPDMPAVIRAKGFMVLEMGNWKEAYDYARSFAPSALVTSVAFDGWEALCKAIKDTPETSRLPVVVIGNSGTSHEQGQVEALRVEEYLPNNQDERALLTCLNQVLSKNPNEDERYVPGIATRARIVRLQQGAVITKSRITRSGGLEHISIMEIMQQLDHEHTTGCLYVSSHGSRGTIFFREGTVCHARLQHFTGKEALFRILAWKTGTYRFDQGPFQCATTITENTTSLLLDSIKLQEELKDLETWLADKDLKVQFPLLASLLLCGLAPLPKLLKALEIKAQSELSLEEILVHLGIVSSQKLRQLQKGLLEPLHHEPGCQTNVRQKKVTANLAKLTTRRKKTPPPSLAAIPGRHQYLEDALLQKIVVATGLVSPEQLQTCQEAIIAQQQQQQGTTTRLGQILVEKGFLTPPVLIKLRKLRDPQNTSLIPGYEVLEKVGQGALSIVYRALQQSLKRHVAIKVFVPGITESGDSIGRFMREAEIASKLDHPHIVKAIDFGNSHGFYYFIMEFLAGQTLEQHLQEHGAYEEKEGLLIAEAVTQALVHLWRRKVVHRDVKPRNIMLTASGVKLCDLGLAKGILPDDLSVTAPGVVMGTPKYMAPEAFVDPTPNFRADVYSLGMTLYEMFTGKAAFAETTPSSVLLAQQTVRPTEPYLVNPNISKPLSALIMKWLDKTPHNRCQEPEEALADLRAVQAGNFPARLPFTCQSSPSHRPLVWLLLVLLVLGVLGTLGWFFRTYYTSRQAAHRSTTGPQALLMVERGDQYKRYGQNAFALEDFESANRFFSEALVCYSMAQKHNSHLQVLQITSAAIGMQWLQAARRLASQNNPAAWRKGLQCCNYALAIQDCPVLVKQALTELKSKIQTRLNALTPAVLPTPTCQMRIVRLWLSNQANAPAPSRTTFDARDQVFLHLKLEVHNCRRSIAYRYSGRYIEKHEDYLPAVPRNGTYRWVTAVDFKKRLPGEYSLEFRLSQANMSISRELSFNLKKLAPDLFYLGVNAQGYEEYRRTRDNMVMVLIPEGNCIIGASSDTTQAGATIQAIRLPAFLIDKYEVSNQQYQRFLEWWQQAWKQVKRRYDWPADLNPECPYDGDHTPRQGYQSLKQRPDLPVTGVDWYDAYAYAQWANHGQVHSQIVYLPSEAQWEKAAGWDQARETPRLYPWGNQIIPGKANYRVLGLKTPQPVQHYSSGHSPYGLYNMAGNVAEWCWDWYRPVYTDAAPSRTSAGHANSSCRAIPDRRYKSIRGGGFRSPAEDLRVSARRYIRPDTQAVDIGFRCVRPVKP